MSLEDELAQAHESVAVLSRDLDAAYEVIGRLERERTALEQENHALRQGETGDPVPVRIPRPGPRSGE